MDGTSAATDGDGEWFVEVRWSQSGFQRGDRQRDLVSLVTGNRVVDVQQMTWDIRNFVIEEPHGFGGTPAADGRVWWDSRNAPGQAEDRPPEPVPAASDEHGDVIAVFIGPAGGPPRSHL